MNKVIICPECESDDVRLEGVCQKVGIAIGGGIGLLVCSFAKINTKKTGIAAGFFTGAAIGQGIGKHLDKRVLCKYKCEQCKTTFRR